MVLKERTDGKTFTAGIMRIMRDEAGAQQKEQKEKKLREDAAESNNMVRLKEVAQSATTTKTLEILLSRDRIKGTAVEQEAASNMHIDPLVLDKAVREPGKTFELMYGAAVNPSVLDRTLEYIIDYGKYYGFNLLVETASKALTNSRLQYDLGHEFEGSFSPTDMDEQEYLGPSACCEEPYWVQEIRSGVDERLLVDRKDAEDDVLDSKKNN